MKILITGATGYLGSILVPYLEEAGHQVISFGSKECDLTRVGSLDKYNDKKYDRIFHLAAWTQAGDFCLTHTGEQWLINQKINTNVLDWWHKNQPQAKLICMGTSCSYPPDQKHSEDKYLTGIPIDSLFTYAMTKRMLYTGLLALNKQYGYKYLCLVPSTLYGPGYHVESGKQMHFIFDLIRKIVRGKRFGEEVVLWGDGNQKRELVFVHDFIKAMLRLVDNAENDLVNIGAGAEYSIRHFAKIICSKTGYDFKLIKFDRSRYVGAKSKCLDIVKLKKYIPDLKYTSLEEGLEKTISWMADKIEK